MRRILILLVLLLGAALFALTPVLPPGLAQEITLIPSPTRRPSSDALTPTSDSQAFGLQTSGLPVIGLPFGETFSTNMNWTAAGAWSYDSETAYDGGGWRLDGSLREQVSTLTSVSRLDLSGALDAQLIFRQRGNMPPSDLLAVDLSLDGGNTWLMVDQQIGVEMKIPEPDPETEIVVGTGTEAETEIEEWDLHIVDLAPYRGQVIQLRFRALTGIDVTGNDPTLYTYSIDNLSIQYYVLPPEFVAIDTGPRTLMGLHLIVGTRREPVIELARRLVTIGWPLGTLKGTTGTESILNEVAAISPQTIIVYRSLLTPLGARDCPNTSNDPTAEAQLWIAGLQSSWMQVQADYYELMNECNPPVEWLIPFTREAMSIAAGRGQCLLVFSFATGNPEPGAFAQLMPVFEYALEHPCQPGRYHGIALHSYGYYPGTLVSESGLAFGFRHRMLMLPILQQKPEAIQIPLYITEAGAGDGRARFRCEDVTRDVIQYTAQLGYDPYVRGFHLWTLGPDGSDQPWADVTSCLSMIGDALVGYYSGR